MDHVFRRVLVALGEDPDETLSEQEKEKIRRELGIVQDVQTKTTEKRARPAELQSPFPVSQQMQLRKEDNNDTQFNIFNFIFDLLACYKLIVT